VAPELITRLVRPRQTIGSKLRLSDTPVGVQLSSLLF